MNKEACVGVIVGRFQVAELTDGHKEIFDYVLEKNHNQNVVVLGLAPTRATKNNPLDFDSRRRMIEETYPGKFTILYIKDEKSDIAWSNSLDGLISAIAGNRDAFLYGGRDCFHSHYSGKYQFEEYHQKVFCSGTEQRELAGKQVKSSRDWRLGCLYATQNKYPTVYPTVDAAIFEDSENPYEFVYLAKKVGEKELRFVGGFSDPSDNSFEQTVKREVIEETGLECEIIGWIGSQKINDWRYRSEEDKIITNFFAVKRIYGSAKANDDIEQIHKVRVKDLLPYMIVPEHRVLLEMMNEWIKKQKA